MIPLHALFQRRIDGDDALLRLARLRFVQAGLAAEVYAGSASELAWMLPFAPGTPRLPMVHLPRDFDLLAPGVAERIGELARAFGQQVSGFVVHDRKAMPSRLPELTTAAAAVSRTLESSGQARLFVEYAAGLHPEQFAAMGKAFQDIERVGLCVDTGHVGIKAARREFARLRPDFDRDLISLEASDPDLPELIHDVQDAIGAALGVLIDLVGMLAVQGKPVHVHLHDGHPLVQGLSDHYGFLLRIPLPFPYGDSCSADPLYGPTGLRAIIRAVTKKLGQLASITLEIHQHEGRLPLPAEDAERIFPHWRHLANAERMNFWLRELAENASLVRASY
jgi:hypothetical protein